MTPAAFHRFMVDPKTPALLDAQLADNARVDGVPPPGPRECCADWATVIDCTDGVDTWECWCCGRTWTALCR